MIIDTCELTWFSCRHHHLTLDNHQPELTSAYSRNHNNPCQNSRRNVMHSGLAFHHASRTRFYARLWQLKPLLILKQEVARLTCPLTLWSEDLCVGQTILHTSNHQSQQWLRVLGKKCFISRTLCSLLHKFSECVCLVISERNSFLDNHHHQHFQTHKFINNHEQQTGVLSVRHTGAQRLLPPGLLSAPAQVILSRWILQEVRFSVWHQQQHRGAGLIRPQPSSQAGRGAGGDSGGACSQVCASLDWSHLWGDWS